MAQDTRNVASNRASRSEEHDGDIEMEENTHLDSEFHHQSEDDVDGKHEELHSDDHVITREKKRKQMEKLEMKERREHKRQQDEAKYSKVGVNDNSIMLDFSPDDNNLSSKQVNNINQSRYVISCSGSLQFDPTLIDVTTLTGKRARAVILRIQCRNPRKYRDSYPQLVEEIHKLFGDHTHVHQNVSHIPLLSRKGKLFVPVSCPDATQLLQLGNKVKSSKYFQGFGDNRAKIDLESSDEYKNNHHSLMLKNVLTTYSNVDLLIAFNNLNKTRGFNIVGFKRYYSRINTRFVPQRVVQIWCGDRVTYETIRDCHSLYFGDSAMVPEVIRAKEQQMEQQDNKNVNQKWPIICYNCQVTGHTAKMCYKKKVCRFCLSTTHASLKCLRKKQPVCRLCGQSHLTGKRGSCQEIQRILEGKPRQKRNPAAAYLRKLHHKEMSKKKKNRHHPKRKPQNGQNQAKNNLLSKSTAIPLLQARKEQSADEEKHQRQDAKEDYEAEEEINISNLLKDNKSSKNGDDLKLIAQFLQRLLRDNKTLHQKVDNLSNEVQDLTLQLNDLRRSGNGSYKRYKTSKLKTSSSNRKRKYRHDDDDDDEEDDDDDIDDDNINVDLMEVSDNEMQERGKGQIEQKEDSDKEDTSARDDSKTHLQLNNNEVHHSTPELNSTNNKDPQQPSAVPQATHHAANISTSQVSHHDIATFASLAGMHGSSISPRSNIGSQSMHSKRNANVQVCGLNAMIQTPPRTGPRAQPIQSRSKSRQEMPLSSQQSQSRRNNKGTHEQNDDEE